jgi:hypothetical protein
MLATALAPIAVVAAMYAASHAAAARIITVSGYVPPLRVELFGAWFLVLAAVGLVLAALARSARSVVWLAAAIVVQSIVLAILARSRGTARPYQALKMMYLLVYPLAVAAMLATARAVAACVAAVALRVKTTAEHVHERDDIMAMSKQPAMEATNERAAALTATGVLRGADGFDRGTMLAAWAVTLAVGAAAVGPVLRSPGARPVVTEALFEAGVWARDHVPRGCVDYLVADDYSAYWLHVAVLRNGRSANGPLGEDLFEAKKSVVRWIVPEGLPYAIAEHFDALPKDIRDNVDVLARFGEAAVIRRRGASTCSGQ